MSKSVWNPRADEGLDREEARERSEAWWAVSKAMGIDIDNTTPMDIARAVAQTAAMLEETTDLLDQEKTETMLALDFHSKLCGVLGVPFETPIEDILAKIVELKATGQDRADLVGFALDVIAGRVTVCHHLPREK